MILVGIGIIIGVSIGYILFDNKADYGKLTSEFLSLNEKYSKKSINGDLEKLLNKNSIETTEFERYIYLKILLKRNV